MNVFHGSNGASVFGGQRCSRIGTGRKATMPLLDPKQRTVVLSALGPSAGCSCDDCVLDALCAAISHQTHMVERPVLLYCCCAPWPSGQSQCQCVAHRVLGMHVDLIVIVIVIPHFHLPARVHGVSRTVTRSEWFHAGHVSSSYGRGCARLCFFEATHLHPVLLIHNRTNRWRRDDCSWC